MIIPDFGRVTTDYVQHRASFPSSFFARIRKLGLVNRGSRLLDVGCGTGALTRHFASMGCTCVGLDRSTAMLEEARRIDTQANHEVHYISGRAEVLPFQEDSFDVVTAGQCWHWFDRGKVAVEIDRVLVQRGLILIAHLDWVPLPGNIASITENLIEQFNPQWTLGGGSGVYPDWYSDLACAGFENIESFSFDVRIDYTPEDWIGRIRASAGIGASLDPVDVARFSAELRERLPDTRGAALAIPHRVWTIYARKP